MSDTLERTCRLCGATGYGASFGGPDICPACDCGIPPDVARLKRDLAARDAELAEALAWSDHDMPIPEDEQIKAAHPVVANTHAQWREAMRMVGAKRSKGALVGLVCWLLQRAKAAERERDLLVSCGMCELMARNPSAMEFVSNLEADRDEWQRKAEEAAQERIKALEGALRSFLHEFGDKAINANVRKARELLGEK